MYFVSNAIEVDYFMLHKINTHSSLCDCR